MNRTEEKLLNAKYNLTVEWIHFQVEGSGALKKLKKLILKILTF